MEWQPRNTPTTDDPHDNFPFLRTPERPAAFPEDAGAYAQPTILLAEDNEDLREVMDYFLTTVGFNVIACCDGNLAAHAFLSYPDIDMLVTDLEMPGRTGLELARDLTILRPSLPVVIVSGSILSNELLAEITARRWTFISKPCQMAALLASLELALHSSRELAAASLSLPPSQLQH